VSNEVFYRENEVKPASSFCRQVAALVNFYILKNRKIDNNSANTKAREKSAHIWNP
jgi:hypothetical protein